MNATYAVCILVAAVIARPHSAKTLRGIQRLAPGKVVVEGTASDRWFRWRTTMLGAGSLGHMKGAWFGGAANTG